MAVTQKRAEKVLASLKAAYAAYLKPMLLDDGSVLSPAYAEPTLVKDYETYGGSIAPYAILWEEGPYEWPYVLDGSPSEEEFALLGAAAVELGQPALKPTGRPPVVAPKGVFVEPINHWSVGIYEA